MMWELFWSFFQIGLFSIGGGYAAVPLIQNQIVDVHGWLSLAQFADIVTIAEMTPGPIAINSATFVGIRVGGIPGALTATLGCVLPSCIIVLLLAYAYYRFRNLGIVQGILSGLRPAVVATIASAGLSLCALSLFADRAFPTVPVMPDLSALFIMAAGFFVLRKWKLSPISVIALSGAAGIILGFIG